MANELKIPLVPAIGTVYAQLKRETDGQIWKGGTGFEAIAAADWLDYVIAATEQDTTGY